MRRTPRVQRMREPRGSRGPESRQRNAWSAGKADWQAFYTSLSRLFETLAGLSPHLHQGGISRTADGRPSTQLGETPLPKVCCKTPVDTMVLMVGIHR